VREEEAADAPEAGVLRAWDEELELELADAVAEGLGVEEGLEAAAGALPLADDELGVLEASGSTYCWLPADCACAAAAGPSNASAAQSASTLRRLSIV
jgi:hypothetical protein